MRKIDTPVLVSCGLALAAASAYAVLGVLRWSTFHNTTFDLAFYTRMAWGTSRGSYWVTIVNASVYGLHIAPVLTLLGGLGRLLPVPLPAVLLVAQAGFVALAAWPLARIGRRHLGPWGALAGCAAWLLHPNVSHVCALDVHPGTLAALPLAWACDAADARRPRAYVLALAGVLACREDLALPGALLGFMLAWDMRGAGWWRRPAGWLPIRGSGSIPFWAGAVALGYLAWWALVIHPAYAPHGGSVSLHFGRFGATPGAVLVGLLGHPLQVLGELSEPDRALHLPRLLLPLAFGALLAPRWILAAAPVLGMNMLSDWPGTQAIDSHYATPALPLLVAGTLIGAGKLARRASTDRSRRVAWGAVALAAIVGQVVTGGSIVSLDFARGDFVGDARSRDARRVLAAVPVEQGAQGPDFLLAHLAERTHVYRGPPPETPGARWMILDVAHRARLAHSGDLLRATEEPSARSFVDRFSVAVATRSLLLLERGRDPRGGVGGRYLVSRFAAPQAFVPRLLTPCLELTGAVAFGRTHERARLGLTFLAHGPCPSDLAVRLSPEIDPARIDPNRAVNDLLFDGILSPRRLRDGDRPWSVHAPIGPTVERWLRDGLTVGLVRESGARPERSDPTWVHVPVSRIASGREPRSPFGW